MNSRDSQRVGHLFNLINRISHVYTDSFLKEKGVGRGQAPYLMVLYHHEGVTQDFLAKQVTMDKSTAARALQKLEADGLVRREQNPQDKRENLVYLTDKGREIHPLVKTLMGDWTEKISQAVSEEEFEALLAILEKMAIPAVAYYQRHEEKEKELSHHTERPSQK